MSDLAAFLAVARERSFTRAAGQLGVSPSALSHTIRGLEERLGVRLLTRTTRSVSPTDAGERLLRTIGPHFDEIRAELDALSEFRDKPAGTIRIVAGDHPAETVLWPAIEKLLPALSRHQCRDLHRQCLHRHRRRAVRRRRPARRGGGQGHDRGADRAGAALAGGGRPDLSREAAHTPNAARPVRAAVHQPAPAVLGGFCAWEFEKDGRELKVRVEGQLAFNRIDLVREAALAGFGIALLPADYVEQHIAEGPARAAARGLVAALARLSPLLS